MPVPVFALRIDASGVRRGASEAQSSISTITDSARDAAKSLVDLKGVLAGLGAGFSLAQVTKEFAAFQSAVVNIGKVSSASLDAISAKLKTIDAALGSSTQLAEGYYQAMSAGITDNVKAMDMLTVASKTAKAAGISQAETINALAKAMNGYSGELKTAEQAANMFFTIEKLGMTTVSELAPVMGDLSGVAKNLGVAYNDLAGSMALITQTSGSTSTAATGLNALLMEMGKPSENLQKLFKGIGVASGEALVRTKGWPDALKAIEAQAQKTGMSMNDIFGSQEAYLAFIKLMEDGFGKLKGYSDEVKTSTDSMSSAWGRYTQTINGQLDEMSNRMSNIAVITGESFGGATLETIQTFNSGLDSLAQNFDTVKSGAVALGAGIVALTAVKKLSAVQNIGLSESLLRTKNATVEALKADLENAKTLRNTTALRMRDAEALATRTAGTQNATRATALMERQQRAFASSVVEVERRQVALNRSTTGLHSSMLNIGSASRSVGSSLLGAFGGPVGVAVTAAAVGIAYFSTKQSEAEKVAKKYADVTSEVEKKLRSLDEATKKACQNTESLTKAQNFVALNESIAEQERLISDLESTISNTIERNTRRNEQVDPLVQSYNRISVELRSGTADLLKWTETIHKQTTPANASLATELEKLLVAYEKSVTRQKQLEESSKAVAESIGGIDNSASRAAQSIQQLSTYLDSLNTVGGANTTQDALESLRKRVQGTDAMRDSTEKLQKAQDELNVSMVNGAIAQAYGSGDIELAKKLESQLALVQKGLGQIGKKVDTSGIKAAESALKSLNAELAKLQMTDAGYQQWQVNQKVAEMEKSLGKANPKVAELRTALGKELEDKFFASIQEYAAPAEAQLRKVKEQYDKIIDTVNKSGLSEAQKKIFNTQSAKEYERAMAGIGGTSQNLVKVNRDMQKQEAELSGDRTRWWEIRKQEVYEETESQLALADTATVRAVAEKKLQLERLQKEGENAGGFAKLWEETYKRVDEAGADMIENFLTGSKNGLDSLKNMFIRTLAEMANAAVLRPITVSVMGVMGGVVGGMFGGSGNAYAGGMPGMNMGMGGTSGGFGMPNMPMGSLIPESWTSGISGFMNTPLPGTSIPGLMGPTPSGAALGGFGLGSAMMYGGMGGLGYSVLGGALGLPQNKYSGITSGIGGALGSWGGSALGGAMGGAMAGSAVFPVVGTVLGALGGGLLSGLFGSKKPKRPAVTGSLNLDLGNADAFDSYDFMSTYDRKNYGKDKFQVTEKDYFTTASRDRNNAGQESARAMQAMLDSVAESAVGQAQALQQALPKTYAQQFSEQLSQNKINQTWDLKGDDISEDSFKQIAEDIQKKVNDSMLKSFQGMDFAEYTNRLKIDQSSLEGMGKFTSALAQMDSMMQTIDLAKNPLSDVEQQAKSVIAQVEAWQKELGNLGWSSAEAAKADEFRTVSIDNMMKGIREGLNPMSQWEQQAKAQVEQIENWTSALKIMSGTEAQIAEVEAIRGKAAENIMKVINDSIAPMSQQEQQTKAVIDQIEDWNKALAILGVPLEEATAKTEAYRNAVAGNLVKSIDDMISPISEVEQQAKTAAAQVADWNKALSALGVPLEEATAKTDEYLKMLSGDLVKSISDAITPTAQYATAVAQANKDIDTRIAALRLLGSSEQQIAELESMRGEYLSKATEAMRRAYEDETNARWAAVYGTGEATNLAIKQAQEMRSAIEKWGAGSWRIDELERLQKAESAQGVYNNAQSEYNKLLSQMQALQQKAAQEELRAKQDIAQKEIKALNDKHGEAQRLFDTYSRLVDTLKDARTDLWMSDANMLGTSSREQAAQIEFDRLYKMAMSGDADAASKMAGVGKELLDLKKLTSVNSEEYMNAFYDVDRRLREAQEYAKLQVTEQEKQLSILNASLEAAQKQYDAITNSNELLGGLAGQQAALAAQLAAADAAMLAALKNLQLYAPGAGSSGGTAGGGTSGGSGSSGGPGGSGNSTKPDGSDGKVKPGTGIYGSSYANEYALLSAKAAAMNRSETLAPGQKPGGWTASLVEAEIIKTYKSVAEWYSINGKAEGFATGGITPSNRPFWVGERGPELMMSPYQYGVMSNTDSQEMLDRAVNGSMSVAVQTDGDMKSEIRMLRKTVEDLVRQNANMQRQMVVALNRIERHTLGTTDALDEALAEGMPVNVVSTVRTQ